MHRYQLRRPGSLSFKAIFARPWPNTKRLQILNLQKDGELSVGAMVAALEIAKPNLSRHLTVMRPKGILATRREGMMIYYRLATPHMGEACRIIPQVLCCLRP